MLENKKEILQLALENPGLFEEETILNLQKSVLQDEYDKLKEALEKITFIPYECGIGHYINLYNLEDAILKIDLQLVQIKINKVKKKKEKLLNK